MQKDTLKLYLATCIYTLALASFAFAGDSHFPTDPPPPPTEEGRGLVTGNTDPSVIGDYQFLKGIWEFLTQNTDLF